MPICLRLFLHVKRLAESRIFWTAGSNNATSVPTIAITTSSSIRVKAFLLICLIEATPRGASLGFRASAASLPNRTNGGDASGIAGGDIARVFLRSTESQVHRALRTGLLLAERS